MSTGSDLRGVQLSSPCIVHFYAQFHYPFNLPMDNNLPETHMYTSILNVLTADLPVIYSSIEICNLFTYLMRIRDRINYPVFLQYFLFSLTLLFPPPLNDRITPKENPLRHLEISVFYIKKNKNNKHIYWSKIYPIALINEEINPEIVGWKVYKLIQNLSCRHYILTLRIFAIKHCILVYNILYRFNKRLKVYALFRHIYSICWLV